MLHKKNTFLIYSLLISSHETLPLGENTEAFQSAPLATITEDAPSYDQKRNTNKIIFYRIHTAIYIHIFLIDK